MIKAVSFLALSFLCGVLAEAADHTLCRWTYLAPVIDGKDDDAAWTKAASVGPFQRAWDKDPAKREPLTATEAKLCWDGDYLYFFARMEDGDLFAEKTEHDADLWFDDVFELFLELSSWDFRGLFAGQLLGDVFRSFIRNLFCNFKFNINFRQKFKYL